MLQRKVESTLAVRLGESREVVEGLEGLGSFYPATNSLEDRRKLRGVLSSRTQDANAHFIQSLLPLKQGLEQLEQLISSIDSQCTKGLAGIDKAASDTRHLLSQAKTLQNQKEEIASQQVVLTAFLDKFQLSQRERNVYERDMKSDSLSADFFQVLNRIIAIQSECKQLLETYNRRAGLDIFEEMAEMLEKAMEKVCRWIIKEFHDLDVDDPQPLLVKPRALSSDSTVERATLGQAFESLKLRPAYREHCIEEFSIQRRVKLAASFVEALTVGSSDSTGRPIEIYSYDAVRYISDMFAWIHQSLASERELALAVFFPQRVIVSFDDDYNSEKLDDREPMKPDSHESDDVIKNHLEKAFESTISPLKSRLESVFGSIVDFEKGDSFSDFETTPCSLLLVAFQALNVIKFYRATFAQLLPLESNLVRSCLGFEEDSWQAFLAVSKASGTLLMDLAPFPKEDLSPPTLVQRYVFQLSDLITNFESSLIYSYRQQHSSETKDSSDQFQADFDSLFTVIFEPIFLVADSAAETLKMDKSDNAVYHINTHTLIHSTLSKFDFASAKLNSVSEDMDKWLEVLVQDQSLKLLQKCGIVDKLRVLQDFLANRSESPAAGSERLSDLEGMDPDSMRTAMHVFYHSLLALGSISGLGEDASSFIAQCDRIQLQELRIRARQNIANSVTSAYSALFDAISDPRNGYDDPKTILAHSPTELSMLLDL